MKTRSSFHGCWFVALAVAAAAVLSAGCKSCKPGKPGDPRAYNIQFRLSDSLKDSSVVADVIGANAYDLERLKTYSINKYWQPGDPLRRDLPMVSFSFKDMPNQTLSITDKKWAQWIASGVQFLVVVADLPGVFEEGKTGSQDPRRQIVPICECYWPPKTKDLAVDIQASGVRVATAPSIGQALPSGW